MGEFKPIETQEQLDAIIGDRLKREKSTFSKQYEGYLSPEDVEKKYAGYLSPEQVAEKYKGYLTPEEAAQKDAKIKGYETDSVKTRVAHQIGIPYELIDKLSGETEEEITEDAKRLSTFIGGGGNQPLFNDSGSQSEKNQNAALKKMASALTKGV